MVSAGLESSELLGDDSESTGVGSELSDELEDSSSLFACFLCFCVLVGFLAVEAGETPFLAEDFGDACAARRLVGD